jgi:hypothetical protein
MDSRVRGNDTTQSPIENHQIPIFKFQRNSKFSIQNSTFAYLYSPKVILEALNVVLAEIIPALNFDKHQIFITQILDAMKGTNWDIDGISCLHGNFPIVQCHHRRAFDDVPMLASLLVALERKTLPRVDRNTLHFVVRGVGEYLIESPGTMIFFVLTAVIDQAIYPHYVDNCNVALLVR